RIRAEMRMGRSIFDLPLRVTFYARVSTDQDEQRNSLENQVQYYTELIKSKKNWTFVPGYIDEGISGTTTRRRDDFNRMIRDAKAGLFDFIITKEISRFSRSTLDSIKYTQELLENGVGVFFQNDNINTLDTDSEFRLVIMAGVAQDEVRKLSERLKFGFRQAIKNGHVLGNDKLYGYDKKDCVMTINEEEAEIVRIIFDLYANHRLGTRKISQKLFEMGYTSREGNAFNVLTIRHMLENPKYKGWYCGNKTQTLDYRTKKKAFLDESEWIMYPDPTIPAIVSEELWDRANSLYKERRNEMMSHSSGSTYHNRYPYSTKIICEEHGTTFHRQVLTSAKGDKEVWQCKVYRQIGRAACSAPQIRSTELDQIMAEIFTEMVKDKNSIVDSLVTVLVNVPKEVDYERMIAQVRGGIEATKQKKDRLLDLHIAGAITIAEFKERNDALNDQLKEQESQLAAIRQEQANVGSRELDIDAIRKELYATLSFEGEIDSALVATILDKIIVKKESTKKEIHLDIYLKLGQKYEAVYSPQAALTGINPPRNTTPKLPIRRI
ncbi:MAG: recombinase family protein, partial [Oscillospiraceae bacterium]|nr:recombinase family protein [Oscillospiraceae bacterium]